MKLFGSKSTIRGGMGQELEQLSSNLQVPGLIPPSRDSAEPLLISRLPNECF